MDDEKLQRWLAAIEKVRAARQGATGKGPSLAAEVARELGMSDADLEAARAEGEAQLANGKALLLRGLHDEALSALAEADALLPDDPRLVRARATAHAARFSARREGADREAARVLARRALAASPGDDEAFAALNAVERTARGSRVVRGAIVASAAVVVALAAWVTLHQVRRAKEVTEARCPDGQACQIAAPLERAPEVVGVTFRTEPAFVVGPDKRELKLDGVYLHRGATELELYTLELGLLDGAGEPVATMEVPVVPSFAPPVREGDSIPFWFSAQVPAEARRARLRVRGRKEEPAPASWPAAREIAMVKDEGVAPHVVLTAGERSREKHDFPDGRGSIECVIEVTNAGQAVLRELSLALEALDAAGNLITRGYATTVVYTHLPPMRPGERRVVKLSVLLAPAHISAARLAIVSAR